MEFLKVGIKSATSHLYQASKQNHSKHRFQLSIKEMSNVCSKVE